MLIALAAAAPIMVPLPPPPPPPCSAAEYSQLDFWVGDWDAEFALPGGKAGHAVNRITRDEYGDCGGNNPSHASHGEDNQRRHFLLSARIALAALWPGAPVTPPPGWAPEPHR